MKKIVSLLSPAIIILAITANAQQPDLRSVNTRIADLLAQMPTSDSIRLKANMADMAILGQKGGLPDMINLLAQSGKGNNSRLEYAISGFSAYASQPGNEEIRKKSATYYCQALDKVTDKVNKAFIISQLELVGKDDAVSCLKKYLSDEDLADPASRALAKINSPLSRNTLLLALPEVKGMARLSVIAAIALSDSNDALPLIHSLVNGEDKNLTKICFYAMASIADPSSRAILAKAAERSEFTYDPTLAVSSYLLYARNLANGSGKSLAEKIAKDLIARASLEKQIYTRTAALELLADIYKEKNIAPLLAAARDENVQYRRAALKFGRLYLNPATTVLWLKQLRKVDDELKVEIIQMLGEKKASQALPAIIELLDHDNMQVRLAAITASGAIGQEKVLSSFLRLIKTGNGQEVAAVKDAILIMEGNNITTQLAAGIENMPSSSKVALINSLASRGAQDQFSILHTLLKSADPDVRHAAFTGLKDVVNEHNIPALFVLLNEPLHAEQIKPVQDAIISALLGIEDLSIRSSIVVQQMKYAAPVKRQLFFIILSSISGEESLRAVSDAFESADESVRRASLNALMMWSDESASKVLYKIARDNSNNDYSSAAVNGYLRSVAIASYPPERKLLMLQSLMDIAKVPDQQQQILIEIGKIRTFPALITAGKFLRQPVLQQTAANAVMSIALSDKSYNGEIVKKLLTHTIEIVNGRDSEYQKTAIRKFIAEMPPGDGFVSMFNGEDLEGWKGLTASEVNAGWNVVNDQIQFNGRGKNLAAIKKYYDFEMLLDRKSVTKGGGVSDSEWNTYRVLKNAGQVTIYRNGEKIIDDFIPANLSDSDLPVFPGEQIELQVSDSSVSYRNIFIREFPRPKHFILSSGEKKEGFKILFDGTNMNSWRGNTTDYIIDNGNMVIRPSSAKGNGSGGDLYTKEEYGDFNFRFEFLLTPGANNGLGIRLPAEGVAAYAGMELQILDDEAEIYRKLYEYQYHGSVYGVLPAKRGFLKPVGEWNYQEVIVKGSKVKIVLNGTTIVDGDIAEAINNGTLDKLEHPGLKRTTGFIGFLGHGSVVHFRNIRIKEL